MSDPEDATGFGTMIGEKSYVRRHWLCSESTNGPTVEPTTKSFADVTFGGRSGGRDDIFMLAVGVAYCISYYDVS